MLNDLISRKSGPVVVPDNLMPSALMHVLGVTQTELAKILSVLQPMLCHIENGKTKNPRTYIAALKRVGLWVD